MATRKGVPGRPDPVLEQSPGSGAGGGEDEVLSASGVLLVDQAGRVLLVRVRYDAT
jgi:hypothetical protein